MNFILISLLILTSLFLILLVLVQRGRGGGLAGALGGMGGQSAFGTKAGDLFTRITIGVAAFWVLLCAVTVKVMTPEDQFASDLGGAIQPGVPAAASPMPAADGQPQPAESGQSPGGPAAGEGAESGTNP